MWRVNNWAHIKESQQTTHRVRGDDDRRGALDVVLENTPEGFPGLNRTVAGVRQDGESLRSEVALDLGHPLQ